MVIPDLCLDLIKKVEMINFYLGRIQNLEFNENVATIYFTSEFDFHHLIILTNHVLNLNLTHEHLLQIIDNELLILFNYLEKILWYYNDHLVNFRYKIKNLYVLLHLFFPFLSDTNLKMLNNRYNNLVQTIPIAGAILVSKKPYQVLLVKNYLGRTWSFAKGKIISGESPSEAAIRECWEETGYNIRNRLNPQHLILKKYRKKLVYFYVIFDIPTDFPFKPENTQEIAEIKWFPINQISNHYHEFNVYINQSYRDLIELLP